jgi:phosphonate transport system substrate-binding protein
MLTIITCQAAIAEPFCAALTRYINDQLGPAKFINDIDWPLRQMKLKAGEIDIGWVCGLTYVRWNAESTPPVKLLAAPVHLGNRYEGKPVYFSDVVVRADSPHTTFADLKGARWAYNEPGSHSGYNVTRWALARMGATSGFFGSAIQSGSHQRSLEMILDGTIDASAIDSTVLELVLLQTPELATRIRIIDSLGPSPVPPWVVRHDTPLDLFTTLQNLLCTMHQHPQGKAVLISGHLAAFAPVTDSDYEPTRQMAHEADQVTW